MGEPGSPGFHNSIAEEEDSISMSELKERRSRSKIYIVNNLIHIIVDKNMVCKTCKL
jgi:hypothetical protein